MKIRVLHLVIEAQLRDGPSELGEACSDPTGDKANHTQVVSTAKTNPIYQSSPESNSEGGGEVHRVGNGEELLKKTVEEIQQETAEELAHAAHLAREAKRG
jgi:hypothetical protein